MDLWNVRKQALAALDNDLKQENEVLEEGFALLDKCIERLHECAMMHNDNEEFAAVCCETLVKAHRLAHGAFSLCLDGLVLEAGSLMRLLLEAWQLLIYFQQQPKRVQLAIAENLPTAGRIARDINVELHNNLQGLREHYTQTSSHISFREVALVTITDLGKRK